jgi:Uma2 family endonuclease
VLGLERRRMSWEDYLTLPDTPKAEWVDGEVVIVNVPPVPDHGVAQVALGALLMPLFPMRVMADVDLVLPRNRIRRPDLMVVAETQTGRWVTDAPLVCVEILSPTTRSEDLLRKSREYAEAGVDQYWIVYLDLPSIEVLRNTGGAWETAVVLDVARPTAEVEVGGRVVAVDLRAVVRI